MAKKKLLKKSDWVSFGVNFSAVVLGIVITFMVDGFISHHGETKRAKEILTLVRDELESNVEGMNTFKVNCRQSSHAMDYFLAHKDDINSIPVDSLNTYGALILDQPIIIMDNISKGLMQSSDFQNGIKDNKLKLDITEAYLNLDSAVESYNLRVKAILEGIKEAQNDEYKRLTVEKDTIGDEHIKALFFSKEGLYFLRQFRGALIADIIESTQKGVRDVIAEIDEALK